MPFTIREIDWNNIDDKGIPKDCWEIMEFFNYAIENNLYPYVPRNTLITEKQILTKWTPDKDININLVAIDNDDRKVIAAVTAFVNEEQKTAVINITKDPRCNIKGAGTALMKKIIEEAHKKGYDVIINTSTQNKAMIRIMQKLGYPEPVLVKEYPVYKKTLKIKNSDAYHWTIKHYVKN